MYLIFGVYVKFNNSRSTPSADGDSYWMYPGICEIPPDIWNGASTSNNVYALVDVSRAVCRNLCSSTYGDYCSSFLYFPNNQTCVLSPYTAEWLVNPCQGNSTLIEFYRRARHLGKWFQPMTRGEMPTTTPVTKPSLCLFLTINFGALIDLHTFAAWA